jgi:hypothetical protein
MRSKEDALIQSGLKGLDVLRGHDFSVFSEVNNRVGITCLEV